LGQDVHSVHSKAVRHESKSNESDKDWNPDFVPTFHKVWNNIRNDTGWPINDPFLKYSKLLRGHPRFEHVYLGWWKLHDETAYKHFQKYADKFIE